MNYLFPDNEFDVTEFNSSFLEKEEENRLNIEKAEKEFLNSLNRDEKKPDIPHEKPINEIYSNTVIFSYKLIDKLLNKENPYDLIFENDQNVLSCSLFLIASGIFILSISSILNA